MEIRIASVEVFPLKIERDVPYLGPLENGNAVNTHGYFIRPGNQTVYSVYETPVLVKITSTNGAYGWGETYTVITPQAVVDVIQDLMEPLIVGRDPHDVIQIHEDLYSMMHVRGALGGFYGDAIAAIDIALWDLRGKLLNLPVCKLLGAKRADRIPVYVSGLPGATIESRAAGAREWIERGFSALKFAAAIADQGEVAELKAIRSQIGDAVRVLVDLHWRYTPQEAVQLITQMEPYGLYIAEAPVHPEDIEGLLHVAQNVKTPIAAGEEFRTPYEFIQRLTNRSISIIQPEMARLGISSFWQVCQLARVFHCKVMPHASIGIGIYQAASLHVSVAISNLLMHEYQHSILDKNLKYVHTTMMCKDGFFYLPDGPGLGIEPREEVFQLLSN